VIVDLTTAVLLGMILLTFAPQSRRRAGKENDGSAGWASSGDGVWRRRRRRV
jgi:hypothetical protein